jgi:hypothetical protein
MVAPAGSPSVIADPSTIRLMTIIEQVRLDRRVPKRRISSRAAGGDALSERLAAPEWRSLSGISGELHGRCEPDRGPPPGYKSPNA